MKHLALAMVLLATASSVSAATPGWTAAEAPPPSWPKLVTAPAGAPNILLIMTDDVGFGASSTFGGPIPTSAFDALAKEGLRYNSFNTTAICSPTRASLLTGRYPHNVAMGNATNVPTGYEGYTSVIPKSAATVARVLRDAGYSTAMYGKGHITPEWESGPAGPFDRWPTGLGFQHFYGFLNADTSMYEPALVDDTRFVEPPVNDPSYHFDKDIADKAIDWIREQKAVAPAKPLFVYYATGSAHAPHHAPPEWLARFRGRFDQGWDKLREETFARQKAEGIIPDNAELTPRPAQLPDWDSLSPEQKRLGARLMEAYAAALSYADAQIGRVIAAMRATGKPEETMVVYIQGDNGSSAEGGINGLLFEQTQINASDEQLAYQTSRIEEIGSKTVYNTYPAGWGWAMNTPFQWYKRVSSHFGGIRNGMVISWPGHTSDGAVVRSQFHHVSDIMPTILEAAHISAPKNVDGIAQRPLDGISMAYSFTQPRAPSHRHVQPFEMMESMGLYRDGWMLSATPAVVPWNPAASTPVPLAQRKWELYHVARDFSQAHDLAATEPARVAAMQKLYWQEAARNNMLPIHGLTDGRAGMPDPAEGRRDFTFHRGEHRIPEYGGAPTLSGKSFTISSEIVVPQDGASGVITAQGGRFGGYALYFKDSRLSFAYNALGERQYRVQAKAPIAAGAHRIAAHFTIDVQKPKSGGQLTLSIDGETVGTGRIDSTLRRTSHTEGLDIGRDTVSPVSSDYGVADSAFNGQLETVSFRIDQPN